MASTNKTQNYELSQYIGSDKPTYLGDYNSDMLKIDTQMKRNADNIQSAGATLDTVSQTASTALTNANNAQTSANDAQTTANSANSTANSALLKANKNESDISKFDLVNFQSFTPSQMVASVGNFNASSKLNCATNSDGSIGKLYGWFLLDNAQTSASQGTVKIQTALRPDTTINLEGFALRQYAESTGSSLILKSDVTIDTNGEVTIKLPTSTLITTISVYLPAVLLFMKDFGDTTE